MRESIKIDETGDRSGSPGFLKDLPIEDPLARPESNEKGSTMSESPDTS